METPSVIADRRLNAVCDSFEAAWQAVATGGPRPDLAKFLETSEAGDEATRSAIARELAALDRHYRRTLGEHPTAAEYQGLTSQVDLSLSETLAEAPPGPGQDFGDYELLAEIARGGMGVVYKARRRNLRRTVALKMILTAHSPAAIERFRAEVEAAANLEHPHITPIYEVGHCRERHFFTMRFIEGGSLAGVARRFPAEPRAAARLVATIADAVQHAHGKAILHRDLKPANILLEGDPAGPLDKLHPLVTDFGLAKHLASDAGQTNSQMLLGTPAYMSPEQAAGDSKAIGTTTDVYGLGAILYELLAGRPPFQQPSIAKLLTSVQTDEPASIRGVNARTPVDLETICLKCLRKAPEERYASAAALASDLRRFLNGEPIKARPVGAWERVNKWRRRQPIVAALAAVCLAVSFLGVGLVVWKWREAESERTRANSIAVAEKKAKRRAQAALVQVRLANYYQAVALADLERLASNSAAAEQALATCDEELRGWEWRYLKANCEASLFTFHGQAAWIGAAAFDATGNRLAIASTDDRSAGKLAQSTAAARLNSIVLIDLGSGETIARFGGCRERIRDLRFSNDGKLLFACGGMEGFARGGEFCLWDAATGELKWRLGDIPCAWRLAVSPATNAVAVALATRVYYLNIQEKKIDGSIECLTEIHAAAYSPDGRRLALAAQNAVFVHDVFTGVRLAEFSKLPSREPRSIAWHPREELLAVGTRGGQALLIDVPKGSVKAAVDRRQTEGRTVERIAFTPDGERLIAACASGTIHVCQTNPVAQLGVLRSHTREGNVLALSPSGHLLASGGWDNKITVWDSYAEKPHIGVGESAESLALAISADGRLAATAAILPTSDNAPSPLMLWDGSTARPICKLKERRGGFHCVAMKGNDWLAHDNGEEIQLLRREDNEWRDWRSLPGHDQRLVAIAFDPQSPRLASTDGRSLKIWRLDGDNQDSLVADIEGAATISTLAYSPRGKLLVVGRSDGAIEVRDSRTARRLGGWLAHRGALTALAVDPRAAEVATGGVDGRISIWSFPAGKHRQSFGGHARQVAGLGYSPDGRRLASTGVEGNLTLWDPRNSAAAFTFRNVLASASSVYFSSDGERLLAAGGRDAALQVWSARDAALDRRRRLHEWRITEGSYVQSKGLHRGAIEHFSEALRREPENASLLVRRAWSLAEIGEWEKAATDSKLATNNPSLTTALNGAGFWQCWMRTAFGASRERKRIAERILAYYAHSPDLNSCYLAGIVCGFREDSVGNPRRVNDMMERVVVADPWKSYYWEVLAVSRYRAGEFAAAIDAARKVSELESFGRGIETFVEALAYLRLGDPDSARFAYDRAVAHYRDHGEYARRSRTRYYDYLAFQREAAKALGLPEPAALPP